MKRIAEIFDAPSSDLPDLMREECQGLLEQIAKKTVRINDRTAKIKVLAAEIDTARRSHTIPGIGPLTALAVEAFAPQWRTLVVVAILRLGLGFSRVNSRQVIKAAWAYFQGGTSRYPQTAHYRRDVPPQLAGQLIIPGRFVASKHVGPEAKNACGNSFGEQNGADHMGHADQT